MKRFYKCPLCGSEFCLKGSKYCRELAEQKGTEHTVKCNGLNNADTHEPTPMVFAGNAIEDLRRLRKDMKPLKE